MPSSPLPDLARAAVALQASHPHAPARDVLDRTLRGCTGRLADFGLDLVPPAPFALLVAEAFDRGMTPDDWRSWTAPSADPALQGAVRAVWAQQVLPAFAAAYGLDSSAVCLVPRQ